MSRRIYRPATLLLLLACLLLPVLVSAAPPPSSSDPVTAFAVIRDKGEIPLARPDSKPAGALDPVTGYLAVAFLDLSNHEAVVWWEPCGCYLPKQYYGNVNLVGWVGMAHTGPDGKRHFKILGRTWDENGGEVPGKHFVVLDLGELP